MEDEEAEAKDYAVFCDNDMGELEQLTNWIDFAQAKKYKEKKTYFGDLNKVVLKRINTD